MRIKRTLFISAIAIMGILVIAVAAFAQTILPTFQYYGQVLSPQEMIERAEKQIPLHCVQRLTEYALLNHEADVFECFDTAEEAHRFSDSMQAADEQLRQDVQRRIDTGEDVLPEALTPAQTIQLLSSNHWALYSHTLYGGHIMNIGNGTSGSHSSVWSIWRE